MIKKTIAFICILTLCLSLCACGKTEISESVSEESKSESVSESESASESKNNSHSSENFESNSDKTFPWLNEAEWLPETNPDYSYGGMFAPIFYEEKKDWEPVDRIEVSGEYADILPVITNETPLNQMISEVDDPWMCLSYYKGLYDSGQFAHISYIAEDKYYAGIDAVSGRIPLSFLRKPEDGIYYTVCKLKNGGYIYYLFDRPIQKPSDSDEYKYWTQDETDLYLYGVLYSEKKVSYSDYASIKIGSNIKDVIEIDPSARMALANIQYARDLMGQRYMNPGDFKQVALLSDGILVIGYAPANPEYIDVELWENHTITAMSTDTDDYAVCSIEYYPEGHYNPIRQNPQPGEWDMHIKILPQDYPPAN